MRAIEQWFVARGVPHFVERRPSAWHIWGRATPLLLVAYVLLGLNALSGLSFEQYPLKADLRVTSPTVSSLRCC